VHGERGSPRGSGDVTGWARYSWAAVPPGTARRMEWAQLADLAQRTGITPGDDCGLGQAAWIRGNGWVVVAVTRQAAVPARSRLRLIAPATSQPTTSGLVYTASSGSGKSSCRFRAVSGSEQRHRGTPGARRDLMARLGREHRRRVDIVVDEHLERPRYAQAASHVTRPWAGSPPDVAPGSTGAPLEHPRGSRARPAPYTPRLQAEQGARGRRWRGARPAGDATR